MTKVKPLVPRLLCALIAALTTLGSVTVLSAAGPVTDDFNTTRFNTGLWVFLNPLGDAGLSLTGTQLKLSVPGGRSHDAALNGIDNAPRILQAIPNEDFGVTVKFDSIPSQQSQSEGLVFDQDAGSFLRFEFVSSGTGLAVAADAVLSRTVNPVFSNTISLPAGTTSLWLRVQRAGNSWAMTWSPDGTNFNSAGTFTQVLAPNDVALFAGNYSPTSAPAFSVLVDSFVSGTVAVTSAPDLTITKSHTGNFALGQTGAAYTVTVTNSGTQ